MFPAAGRDSAAQSEAVAQLPREGWSQQPCSRTVEMWHRETWVSGCGGGGLDVILVDFSNRNSVIL